MNFLKKLFELLFKKKEVVEPSTDDNNVIEDSFQELIENAEIDSNITVEEDCIMDVDDSNYQSEEGEYND